MSQIIKLGLVGQVIEMSDSFPKTVHVRVIRDKESGMLLAISDDLKGLYVHARDDAELYERLPVTIKLILEEKSNKSISLKENPRHNIEKTGFESPYYFEYAVSDT